MDEFGSSADFTARSRVFLTLSRQITQVTTDYKILAATLQHLKAENEWVRNHLSHEVPDGGDTAATLHEAYSEDIWDVFIAECKLLKTYAKLYEKRTKIGINEVKPPPTDCIFPQSTS